MTDDDPIVVRGWSIFAHPLFLDQFEALIDEVELAKGKDPTGYRRRNSAKRLAAVVGFAFDAIPEDPARSIYRLGDSLGPRYRHWLRIKFFQQYRLFFRYSQRERIIIYGWVNDEHTLRAYESGKDAYRVFRRMLERGHLPDAWPALQAASRKGVSRFRKLSTKLSKLKE